MKWSLLLGSLTVAVLGTACGSSIDPAAKADVDARIASLQTHSITIASAPAGALAPMPLAAGQWVQYKMTLSNGQAKLLTEKILKQQGNAFWYEVVHDTYQGRTVEQLLVAFGNDRYHPHVELLALRKKDPQGRVVEVPARQLSLPLVTYDTYRAKVAQLVAPWPPLPREPTVVSAGRFEGCYRGHSESRVGQRDDFVTDSWRHPSVPLSGLVRLQDNHAFVSELVAYGTSDAQSDF
jgi:hypothetical protein